MPHFSNTSSTAVFSDSSRFSNSRRPNPLPAWQRDASFNVSRHSPLGRNSMILPDLRKERKPGPLPQMTGKDRNLSSFRETLFAAGCPYGSAPSSNSSESPPFLIEFHTGPKPHSKQKSGISWKSEWLGMWAAALWESHGFHGKLSVFNRRRTSPKQRF